MTAAAPVDIGTLVTQTPGVYGGRPCLEGTRFPILQIAVHYNAGTTPEELASDFGLSLPHVYAGIAYYLANRAAIDKELEDDEREYLRMAAEAAREQVR